MNKYFIEYRDDVIENFEEDCVLCGSLNKIGDLTDKQIDVILDRFSEHEKCYEHKEEFDQENLDIFSSVIYGDNESASIECMHCNSVIIDDNVLKEIEG